MLYSLPLRIHVIRRHVRASHRRGTRGRKRYSLTCRDGIARKLAACVYLGPTRLRIESF